MAFAIRCKTCGKISKANYVNKPKIENKKEFDDCIKENHTVKVEKVY
jgi:DNA-directed RNA polymerase subunit N (RpoN/RPB10)